MSNILNLKENHHVCLLNIYIRITICVLYLNIYNNILYNNEILK